MGALIRTGNTSQLAELTWIDRALLSIAPAFAMKRLRARTVAQSLRHYEAAQPGRRTQNWHASTGDADAMIRGATNLLRWHARDLLRNNAWARRAQGVVANNTVSWGITPKPIGEDPKVNAVALKLFKKWADATTCESEGRHNFAALQHLAMKAIVSDGEVLLRRRGRLAKDGLPLPLQVQVLEADYLDSSRNDFSSISGGPIVQGIEFDKLGRRAAYWLWSQHPGSGRNVEAAKRVPAEDVLHIFNADRPGQSRGVSWLGTAIVDLKDLSDFDDAELMRQKIAACFAAFVADTEGVGAPVGEQDQDDPLVETFEPGMITQLPPGKTVTFANPPTLTGDSLAMRTLRRVAAGIGITYEDLTTDYSQVNFSSARMARQAHWANVGAWQHHMLIPLMCQGVWNWAMEAAFYSGQLPVSSFEEIPSSEWAVPPMPMLEPDKEGLAYSRLIRNGVMTWSQMVREQGGDPEAHFTEYAADAKRFDDLKIDLDSDVRRVSAAGLTQVRAGAAPKLSGDKPADNTEEN